MGTSVIFYPMALLFLSLTNLLFNVWLIDFYGSGILSAFGMALADVVHEEQEPAALIYKSEEQILNLFCENVGPWRLILI